MTVLKKPLIYWPLLSVFVLADCTSKRLIVERLQVPHVPHDVIGESVRFTLAYNTGAAFSTSLGPYSRYIFGVLAAAVLVVLFDLYRKADVKDRLQVVGLALVSAGALGNLIDRLRWSRGVVDFIDIGTTSWRFWTFNVADACVTVGAILLGLALIRADRAQRLTGAGPTP
ncbi:MAG: signal peptidase II [Gemmatimonadaceae bacterium]